MAWQEPHTAWLKLYHQTLWKVSKTINYQDINGGLRYVKHNKMGDLIKKLIILPFSQFQTFQMNMAYFLLFLLPSLLFLSSSLRAQKRIHTFLSVGSIVLPLWNQAGYVWSSMFSVTIIYFNHSSFIQSHWLSLIFFFFFTYGKMEELIPVPFWRKLPKEKDAYANATMQNSEHPVLIF